MNLIVDGSVFGGITLAAGFGGMLCWRYIDAVTEPWRPDPRFAEATCGCEPAARPRQAQDGPSDPDAHMKGLRSGAERTAERLTDTFQALGFMLPLTARTLAARKWAATFTEGARPAAQSFASRLRAAVAAAWARFRAVAQRPGKPADAPKGGRHRAPGGKAVPTAKGTLLHGEPEPDEPQSEPEALAHEDATELIPALPAAQEDPTGRLFPWATGEFAAFVEAGEPA